MLQWNEVLYYIMPQSKNTLEEATGEWGFVWSYSWMNLFILSLSVSFSFFDTTFDFLFPWRRTFSRDWELAGRSLEKERERGKKITWRFSDKFLVSWFPAFCFETPAVRRASGLDGLLTNKHTKGNFLLRTYLSYSYQEFKVFWLKKNVWLRRTVESPECSLF